MTNRLFIAEKPSLAEAIAKALGEMTNSKISKSQEAFTVGDDKVTWLYGHMYQTAMPQHYDPKYAKWNIADLPIIPEKWKLIPSDDKKAHIARIKGLLSSAREAVNAGDAGREGQLLVDELLIENKWDPFGPQTQRLWVSSVVHKDILKALAEMRPNKERRPLYDAAIGRQRADWLHGINLTGLYTKLAQAAGSNDLISVGRVQTPTLKLVVDRDREIANFRPTDHFLPYVIFEHQNGTFRANWVIPKICDGLDSEGRLVDKQVAQAVAARVSGRSGKITDYKTTAKSVSPPLLHNLAQLQADCSAKFGLTAQQTLDVAQALYEKYKLTTYPRSDSRHLSQIIYDEQREEIMEGLKSLGDDTLAPLAGKTNLTLKSPAWNDSKVSDHHGIIPTTEVTADKLRQLDKTERRVFDLIARTFIAQFYPDQRYKSTNVEVKVDQDVFKASGRTPVDEGWRVVFKSQKVDAPEEGEAPEEEEEAEGTIPLMQAADPVKAGGGALQAKRTSPPPAFTDGTLVIAMENIHNHVKDPEKKKRLRETDGIGTQATRAPMIEMLINKRKFLKRSGKKLVSTSLGQAVIDTLPEDVSDPIMTAVWEGHLTEVAQGKRRVEDFLNEQIETLKLRIDTGKRAKVTIKGKTVAPIAGHGDTCSACGKGELQTREIAGGAHKGKKYLACSNYPDCEHRQWPRVVVEPVAGHGEKCPSCADGKLVTRQVAKGKHEGKKFLSCDKYPGCTFTKWPDVKVDPIEGHGDKCSACGDGVLITKMVFTGEHKGKKYLSCNRYPECKHSKWPARVVPPVKGHGAACPTCGTGKLTTKAGKSGKPFLSCERYPECKHVVWPEDDVAPMPGHGSKCKLCNTGTMKTKLIRSGDNKGKRYLGCSSYPECKGVEWGDDDKGGGKKQAGSKSAAKATAKSATRPTARK